MARVFEHPPQGLNYNDYEGSVPNFLLYRLKIISGLSKQTLSIVPTSGQGSVYNGSKTVVSLPMNSLLDLETFEMNFYEKLHMLAQLLEIKKIMFKQDFFLEIFNQ